MSDKKENPKTLSEAMNFIQKNLVAPKNQFNKFGNYKYRSCEDILQGLKDIMPDNCYVTISDEPFYIERRFYIKAIANFHFNGEVLSSTGYAREEDAKKGMDGAQVTGSSSSYARKYALNGLFCIDDTKDADSRSKEENVTIINESQLSTLQNMMIEVQADEERFLEHFGVKELKDLPQESYDSALLGLNKKKAKMIEENANEPDKELLGAG